MWKGEQRSCIGMFGLTGELKEWVVCRNLSVSVYLNEGKRKRVKERLGKEKKEGKKGKKENLII